MAQAMTQSRPMQAITGLMPPQLGETRVREEWRTVLGINAGLATLARRLQQTILLLPVGWLILLGLFVLKLAPFIGCTRYTLTNRRLMIRRGWKPAIVQEVALADIDDVRLDPDGVDPFYVAGTLAVISKGQAVMTLLGCPEPEGFRQAVMNAVTAWVPGREMGHFQPASAVKSEKPGK
jgi:hypothetical protein